MGIKYSMEGFIKYLIINTKGNSKRDHNASWRSLILRSGEVSYYGLEKSHITVGHHDRG